MTKFLLHKTYLYIPFVFTCLLSNDSSAQEDTVYFDNGWFNCSQEDARYYRVFEEVDTLLKITDYYAKGGVQFIGYVENRDDYKKILKIRGDFEHKTIGESQYFQKNGVMDYTRNMQPFNKNHGIESRYFDLLKSVDSVNIDSSQLHFETYLYKKEMYYGFTLGKDIQHGTWLNVDTETGKVLSRSLFLKGKNHGLSIEYWKNGNIKTESPYENGFLNGELKRYNKKGVLVKGKVFEKGVLIETWMYKKPRKN